MGKTGGGSGTNQYQVRGQSKAAERLVYGYPPDQVIKRGKCTWLRAGFDDIWCLRHRQLVPELRQLAGLQPCITRLGPKLQGAALATVPIDAVQQWLAQSADLAIRQAAVWGMSPEQLGWATKDEDIAVRLVAVERMPENQLQWAARDQSADVRWVAARRMAPDQLTWAARDPDWQVREAAANRMPPDQLDWAKDDPDARVREAAANRRQR